MNRIFLTIVILLLFPITVQAAVFTSVTNGNWNTGATWGNAGSTEGIDYPGSADTATIGHTVTVNSQYPSTGALGAITINSGGILDFLAMATTKLTIDADVTVNSGGELRMGTIASPIGSAYTATIYADATAAREINITAGGKFSAQGSPKTYYHSMLNANIVAGAKSLTTADSTGWAVGDYILVPTTSVVTGETESYQITGISGATIYIDSNGDGTGVSPAFAYAHESVDCPILNITRNVILTRNKTGSTFRLDMDSNGNTDNIDFDWVDINGLGHGSTWYMGAIGAYTGLWLGKYRYCVFQDAPDNAVSGGNNIRIGELNDIIFYNNSDNGIAFSDMNSQPVFSYLFAINNVDDGIGIDTKVQSAYYYETTLNNIWAIGNSAKGMNLTNEAYLKVSNLVTHSNGSEGLVVNGDNVQLDNVKSYYNGTYGLWFNQDLRSYVWDRDSYYGSDGTTAKANSSSDIRLGSTSYSPLTIRYYGTDVTLGSASKIAFRNNPAEAAETRVGISGYGHTEGRSYTRRKYGYISDQITGGQTAGWANGGSGISAYLDPTSTTNELSLEFLIPVVASTNPVLKFYVRKTSVTANPTLNMDVYDTDHITKLIDDTSISLTDSWAQYTVPVFTPSQNGFCRVVLRAKDGTTTGDIGIDDVEVTISGTTYTADLDADDWHAGELRPWFEGVGGGGGGSEHSFTFVQ